MKPIQRALLGVSLAYALSGLVMAKPIIVLHLLAGLKSSLLLLAAGSLPLVMLLLLAALWADRLQRSEQRLLLVGGGLASLILVPLLALVF